MTDYGGRAFRSRRVSAPRGGRKGPRGLMAFLRSLSLDMKTFISAMSIGGMFLYAYFFMRDLPSEVYVASIPAVLLTGAIPVIYFMKDLIKLRSPGGRISRRVVFITSLFTAVFLLIDILFLADIFGQGTLFGLHVDLSHAIHFVFLLILVSFGATVLMLAITEEDLEGGEDAP